MYQVMHIYLGNANWYARATAIGNLTLFFHNNWYH
jgi:hypothetical protein